MKIGIIGISSLTLEIASRCSLKGYEVKIYNPKGNSLIRDVAQKMGSHVSLCSLEQAADTDIVLLFIPKGDLQRMVQIFPDMSGKLIIHTSSLIFDPRSLLSSITSSLTYRITASLLPAAHIVKLFNPVDLKTKTGCSNCANNEIFFIADHNDSRNHAREFLRKINFHPLDLSRKLHLRNTAFNLKSTINPIKFNPLKNNLN